jgi:hypothetical protein
MTYYSRNTTERKDIVIRVSLLRLVTFELLDGVMKTVGCILVDSEILVSMHYVPTAVNSSSFNGSGHVSNS